MPNTPSAKKALRQADTNRRRNYRKKQTLKATKKVALASPSLETFAAAQKAIDKAAKTGLLKKKEAARRKSRLAKAIARANAKQ